VPLMILETVPTDTRASRATSLIVDIFEPIHYNVSWDSHRLAVACRWGREPSSPLDAFETIHVV
jgi:hypothetical protein